MISCKNLIALKPRFTDYVIYTCLLLYLNGLESKMENIEVPRGTFIIRGLSNAGIDYEMDWENSTYTFYGPTDEYNIFYGKMDTIERELMRIECLLIIDKYENYHNCSVIIADEKIREFVKSILGELEYFVTEEKNFLIIRGW